MLFRSGCSFDDLYIHIEAQFVDGMNWNNINEWHIDHIIPVSFSQSKDELLLLNHYTNLRPLWAKDNLLKGSSITHDAMTHPLYKHIIDLRQ